MARTKRKGLFLGYWFDTTGRRLGKVSRAQLAEAYRLRSDHRDVVAGRIPQSPSVGLAFGERMPLG